MILSWLLCISVFGGSLAAPTGQESENDDFAMNYFKKYGHMGSVNPMFGEMTDEKAFPKAIMEFQTMYGLHRSGKLDEPTMVLIQKPRCGNKDIMKMNDMTKRKKRYALQGSMWPKGEITWRISQYTPDMLQQDVDTEVERAFGVWSMIADIDFRRVYSSGVDVDINISFVPRSHGDGFNFDGQGGTLAHAFFPQYGGDVHMDEAEQWTINTSDGVNLFQVIAHEFGHSLGLSHSNIQEALMAPFYQGYKPDFMLHQDDIAGIQAIYGPRTQTTNRGPTAATRPPLPPTLLPVDPKMEPMPCKDGKVDAMMYTEAGVTYAFRQNYYMVIDNDGIAPGYPRKISEDWPNLPDDLDAAISFPTVTGYAYDQAWGRYVRAKFLNERLFFFKGSMVYLYNKDSVLAPDYPKSISEQFPGLPNDIDAAFIWDGNGKPYFFKGSQYYRYDSGRIYRDSDGRYYEGSGYVPSRYPADMSVWKGVPNGIDAVFVWRNGRTYFFIDSQYYRFHDRSLQVESKYPRGIRGAWFGCTSRVKDGRSTTMMMEADMKGMPKFEVMEHSNGTDTTSGQSPLSYSLLSVVSLLIAKAVLH